MSTELWTTPYGQLESLVIASSSSAATSPCSLSFSLTSDLSEHNYINSLKNIPPESSFENCIENVSKRSRSHGKNIQNSIQNSTSVTKSNDITNVSKPEMALNKANRTNKSGSSLLVEVLLSPIKRKVTKEKKQPNLFLFMTFDL